MSDNEDDVFISYIKTMSFLGALALIILWVLLLLISFVASFGDHSVNEQAINDRLKAVEVVSVKNAPKSATTELVKEVPSVDKSTIDSKAIVTATCAACHSIGLLESPKIGDKEAWNQRLEANSDLEGLVKSAIKGKGAMPARGGNAGLSDAEVKAAIEYMMQ
jgi:cytochrome c5